MTGTGRTAESDDGVVLGEIDLSRSVTVQLTVVGLLGFLVALAAFGGVYELVTGEAASLLFAVDGVAWWNGGLGVLVFALLATAIIVPHEYVHGLAIRYYGGDVSYGVGVAHFVLPYAYATTEHEFTRDQFAVVAMAPLVALTLVGVPLMVAFEWSWLVVPLAANAAGAVGDVWMTLTVLGYPAHVRVTDSKTGMAIVGRGGDTSPGLSPTHLAWDALVGAATATVAAFLLVGIAGPVLLSALDVQSITLGTPGTFTYLFDHTETPDSVSFGVGMGWTVIGAFLGLAYALVKSHLRHRRVARGADADV